MMNKELKVATSTRDIDRKSKKIYNTLCGYPEGLNPKSISAKTGINVNTVKSILPKIKGVTKVMRGLYKVDKEGDTPRSFHVELVDWNFHNLVLFFELRFWGGRVVSECFDFLLGRVDFSISKVGKVCLRLSTDWPLNVSSISLVFLLFQRLVGDFSSEFVGPSSCFVSTVEFNRDYRNLRLDGVQSVSVDSLVEQFKVYQKRRGLRVEHKTKVPLSVDSIVDVLSNQPSVVDFNVKLNGYKDELRRLNLATEKNLHLLFQLHDELKKKS